MSVFDNPLQWERVTKLDAAKRQLDCALKLWFEDGDIVSIHTLVGAAYHIANDIHKKRGGKDILFNPDIVAEDYKEEFRKALRKDFMFFKHADRDADSDTMFPPFITLLFVFVAIETLRSIQNGKMTAMQMAFTFWVVVFAPDLISDNDMEALFDSRPVEYQTFVRGLKKREFLEHALDGFAQHAESPSKT